MNRIVLLSTLALTGIGCAHAVGYHSANTPSVTVAADPPAKLTSGNATSLTVQRNDGASWNALIELLLSRAGARNHHLVTEIQARWTRKIDGKIEHCVAPVVPDRVSRGALERDAARTAKEDGSRQRLITNGPQTADRTQPDPGLDRGRQPALDFVTDFVWALRMGTPTCRPADEGEHASSARTLVATAY